MEKQNLEALIRTETGKEKMKKLRKEGGLPAVLYGRHMETPLVLSVNKHDFEYQIQHSESGLNTIFQLAINNNGKGNAEIAIAHDVQVNPVTGDVLHVDFLQVNVKEKIHTHVPIKLVGVAPGVKMGGRLVELIASLDVKCLPLEIPPYVEVDVSALEIGDGILIKDATISGVLDVLTSEDQMIVHVEGARREAIEEEVTVEGEAEGEQSASAESAEQGAQKESSESGK